MVLSKEGYSVCNKQKLSFAWCKDFFKIGSVSGLESFVRNIAYMLMVSRMVNVVGESGVYWVANNFIWGWMLLPVLQLGELIKQEVSTDNAHFIAADTFNDIHEFYLKNKKAFTLTKDSIIIELGNDAASKKTLTSWVNTLPPEVQTKSISTRDCNKMTMNRREFESCSHIKFKRFGWF